MFMLTPVCRLCTANYVAEGIVGLARQLSTIYLTFDVSLPGDPPS